MENIDFNKYFYYDETSPTFLRHKIDKYGGKDNKTIAMTKDSIAGNIKKDGYVNVKLNSSSYKAGRVILSLHGVEIGDGQVVDHLDGNRTNNVLSNLRVVEVFHNTRNRKMPNTNTSGTCGVHTIVENGVTYARSQYSKNGKQVTTRFNVNKLGIMVAFRDAVIHRQKMIEELNSQGAGYTSRHGKES